MQPRSTKIAREPAKIPAYTIHHYRRNTMGSYSRQTGTTPTELILQQTKCPHIGANNVLVYRAGYGTAIFTGLRATKFKTWFSGDQCNVQNGKKVKSLLLVRFSDLGERLTIVEFSKIYKTGTALTRFTARVLPHILPTLP